MQIELWIKDSDLVVRDSKGEVYTVRYEAVNAMLLNEFLKEHRKVEEQDRRLQQQEATIAQQQNEFASKIALQQKQIETLTAGLQKVSTQVEMSKPAPQMVLNNQKEQPETSQPCRSNARGLRWISLC